MNYLNKYNPIGDVDMIRILERLDAGIPAEDIITELPTNNRDEARELLDTITLLETARSTIIPPKETLQNILRCLDAPIRVGIFEDRGTSVKEIEIPAVSTQSIPSPFSIQKYFFPVSIMAAAVLLIAGGSFFAKSPIGSDAVLYELGTEDLLDVFPDDGLLQMSNETLEILPGTASSEVHFDALVGEEKDTEQPGKAVSASSQPPTSVKSVPIESMQSLEQFSSMRSASLYGDTLETTIIPLVQNERLDAYGVFPEDNFSIYLHTLTDLPIDNL